MSGQKAPMDTAIKRHEEWLEHVRNPTNPELSTLRCANCHANFDSSLLNKKDKPAMAMADGGRGMSNAIRGKNKKQIRDYLSHHKNLPVHDAVNKYANQ